MIQVANLAGSLAAIKKLVYEDKIVKREELLDALRKNFEGYEILRARLLNKVPKYGNDVEWVDAIGVKWARYFRARIGTYTNHRGGRSHTGMYTVSAHVPMGENVRASPDGRFLRTFVDLEIPHIQFNVVRKENLLAAKEHPEEYRSLTVRVAGYTAYFTELQDEIIARTSYDDI